MFGQSLESSDSLLFSDTKIIKFDEFHEHLCSILVTMIFRDVLFVSSCNMIATVILRIPIISDHAAVVKDAGVTIWII